VRRLPAAPGACLLQYQLNSPVGIPAGPLLNSRWVERYARLGFDLLTYATVRTSFRPAYTLPNIRLVENQTQVAVTGRRSQLNGTLTLAVSTGMPSMDPEVWRKDLRRARERIGPGQVLIASVVGTPEPGGDAQALIADYGQCAAWAAEAGADVVEVHLACLDTLAEQPQMIYENLPLAAQILYRVRTTVSRPVVAKLGLFRSPRALHETATKLAAWVDGFVLAHGVHRPVVDEHGHAAFEGSGRERADIVGGDTFAVCSRQVEELLSWRKAGAWGHAILAAGGITTPDRARHLLREGADAVLAGTAALFDPLFAVRWRQGIAEAHQTARVKVS
jgi:dihydroorotate dehydrogenase